MATTRDKITSVLVYAVTSFLISVINKVTLTSYSFPSSQFLGLSQITCTIIILLLLQSCNFIELQPPSRQLWSDISPLPLIYAVNLLSGLGGTKKISLPMFVALRRLSIWLTMMAEWYLLKKAQTVEVQLSVYAMLFGSLVAALNDLSFDAVGYLFLLVSDVATAANGVVTKLMLDKQLGKFTLMFYNCLISLLPVAAIFILTDDSEAVLNFASWSDPGFIISFTASSVMGCLLMFAVIWCTDCNSALTTTIIGVLKNALVTYLGLFIGGDYTFSVLNFVGLNISFLASVYYAYLTFGGGRRPQENQLPTTNTASTS